MTVTNRLNGPSRTDLIANIARRVGVDCNAIFPFSDFTQFLCELFRWQETRDTELAVVSPVRPEVEIAADRAELRLDKIRTTSPFSYDINELVRIASIPDRIFYLDNPNRTVGAVLPLSELTELITAMLGRLIIVDEHYFEYSEISAIELTERINNLLVVRSFNASFGNRSITTGYAVGSCETIEQLGRYLTSSQLSLSAQRTMIAALSYNQEASSCVNVHGDEALRVSKEITRLGIQCRLTPADFLLMRVASPDDLCERLVKKSILVESISNLPDLENYVRYEIQAPGSHDRLIEALQKLPPEMYRMKASDQRGASFGRKPEAQLSKRTRTTARRRVLTEALS